MTSSAAHGDEANGSSAPSIGQMTPTDGQPPRLMAPQQLLVERSKGVSADAGAFVAHETKGVVRTFLDVRGTHLAALIAFYGLLAFFPVILIGLAAAGLIGEQNESSLLIEQLNRAFPGASGRRLATTVNEFREQAVYLAAIGGAAVLWSSLGLFSALESAFNLVYGLKNRPFARGKALMFVILIGSLAVLLTALIMGSLGVELLIRLGGAETRLAYGFAIALSTTIVFGLLWVAYRVIPNTRVTWKQALPGAAGAAAALIASFQAVPLFVRFTDNLVALRAFGGATLLLVWLFLMANIIVLGAVVNWRLSRGARKRAALEPN
jgi:membrane protein